MSSVAFPGFANMNRRSIRMPVNQFDKSTVVSIYPRAIFERKVTISPGDFRIEAGSYDKPAILVVGPSSWFREIDQDQPLIEIPVPSVQIADSLVKDFCNGILGSNMSDSMPGLFWLPQALTVEQIKKDFKQQLDTARVKQNAYYQTLVKMADALWARTNGNPLVISDDMRLGAKELGLNKDWTKEFQQMESVRCKACGSLKNPEFPVCPTCKAIDNPELASKLGIKFAQ